MLTKRLFILLIIDGGKAARFLLKYGSNLGWVSISLVLCEGDIRNYELLMPICERDIRLYELIIRLYERIMHK